jgi:hypothetical protein
VTQELREWTLKKITQNPQLFGGDESNPAIIKTYLMEVWGVDLPEIAISQSVAVSRIKNKLLEEYPQYDSRQKHKPKHKRHLEDAQVA